MLSAIRDIGELISKNIISSERQIQGKVIFVLIDIDNSSYEIDLEDFDNTKIACFFISCKVRMININYQGELKWNIRKELK